MIINHFIISGLVTSITTFLLAVFVLFINWKKRLNKYFAFYTLSISIWAFSVFMHSPSLSGENAIFWGKLLHVGAIFIPLFFLYFTFELLNIIKSQRIVLSIATITAVVYLILDVFTKLLINGTVYRQTYCYPKPGIFYILFFLYFVACVVYGMLKLVQAYSTSKAVKKNQLKYLIFGSAFGYLGGLNNFMITIDLNIFPFHPFGAYAIAIYTLITFYAITRYRLMDINVIIRKGTVYSAIALVFSMLYLGIIYGSEYFIKPFIPFNIMWFTIPAIFVLAMFFQPISERVEEFIERNVFKKQYLAEKIAKKFSEGIKELMGIDELLKFITRSAVKVFKLKGSAIFVFDEASGQYRCLDARGDLEKHKGMELTRDNILIDEMKRTGKAIIGEELRMSIEQEGPKGRGRRQVVFDEMRKIEAAICVPSVSRKGGSAVIAFLLAGEKEAVDIFSVEDIALLETFAKQAAVSIENALMYKSQVEQIEQSMETSKLSELGSTAAGVAHEAKNALNYINVFYQVLNFKKDDQEFLKEASENFSAETERIRILMEGVVGYSAPAEMDIRNENLKKIIDETTVLIRDQAKGKDITLEINVDGDISVLADRNSIKQVFLNLFLNALEAMQKNGKLSVVAARGGGRMIVSVSDTGCGIPEGKLQKIFDPFYTTKEAGTGLGLAIVKKAVEANKGILSVESKAGVGTTFKIAFTT